jgi:hypothetical protein
VLPELYLDLGNIYLSGSSGYTLATPQRPGPAAYPNWVHLTASVTAGYGSASIGFGSAPKLDISGVGGYASQGYLIWNLDSRTFEGLVLPSTMYGSWNFGGTPLSVAQQVAILQACIAANNSTQTLNISSGDSLTDAVAGASNDAFPDLTGQWSPYTGSSNSTIRAVFEKSDGVNTWYVWWCSGSASRWVVTRTIGTPPGGDDNVPGFTGPEGWSMTGDFTGGGVLSDVVTSTPGEGLPSSPWRPTGEGAYWDAGSNWAVWWDSDNDQWVIAPSVGARPSAESGSEVPGWVRASEDMVGEYTAVYPAEAGPITLTRTVTYASGTLHLSRSDADGGAAPVDLVEQLRARSYTVSYHS